MHLCGLGNRVRHCHLQDLSWDLKTLSDIQSRNLKPSYDISVTPNSSLSFSSCPSSFSSVLTSLFKTLSGLSSVFMLHQPSFSAYVNPHPRFLSGTVRCHLIQEERQQERDLPQPQNFSNAQTTLHRTPLLKLSPHLCNGGVWDRAWSQSP